MSMYLNFWNILHPVVTIKCDNIILKIDTVIKIKYIDNN